METDLLEVGSLKGFPVFIKRDRYSEGEQQMKLRYLREFLQSRCADFEFVVIPPLKPEPFTDAKIEELVHGFRVLLKRFSNPAL